MAIPASATLRPAAHERAIAHPERSLGGYRRLESRLGPGDSGAAAEQKPGAQGSRIAFEELGTLKIVDLNTQEPDPAPFLPPGNYTVVVEKASFTITWGAR